MDQYRVYPDTQVKLSDWDPDDKGDFDGGKKEGKKALKPLTDQIESLQELLYAEGKQKVLIVIQAMDSGGKDGTIRHVFDGVNPQGVNVASFKKPTERELAQDFLWRIHQRTPRAGKIVIFNRSHYEDVLIVRVHNLVPEEVWRQRYDHINNFEKLLADEGTTIRKFYLHISKEEQKERFQSRLDEPHKRWKFNKADLDERERWDEYMLAYEEMLSRTSTPWAPWYIVPANRKWYRNLVISRTIIETLESLDMEFPEAEEGLEGVSIPD